MAGAGDRRAPWWITSAVGVPQATAQHHVLNSRGVATETVITAVHRSGRTTSADLVWRTTAGSGALSRDVDVSGPLVLGGRVPLRYDPEQPSDFEVGGVGDDCFAVLWLGVLVALAGAVAVLRGLGCWRVRVRP